MKGLFSAFLIAALTACSFNAGEGRREQDDRVARERRQAQEKVALIEGHWSGSLQRGTESIPVQMIIRATPVNSGRTADGTPIIRYDTSAAFSSSADSRYTANFVGDFDPTSGDIIITNSNAKVPDDLQSLRLRFFAGGSISGTLEAVNYRVGRVDMTRSSNQSGDNPQDEEDRLNELERQVFRRIEGYYHGSVTTDTGSCFKYQVCVRFYIEEQSTPRGGFKPNLKATYYREDITPGHGISERILKVTYNYRSTPQSLIMDTAGVPQPYPGSYSVQVIGNFPRGVDGDVSRFTGTHLVVNQGISGRLDLSKVPACPARPNPGRCLVPGQTDL